MADKTRINKYIAFSYGLSRREADELIAAGKVTVNGQPANLGEQVDETDHILVSGRSAPKNVSYIYLLLNKPVGFVCSRKQQGEYPTIYSLLPKKYHHLKPVGRLDRDSSGLLLLTNDGDFAHRMTHPKFKKTKIYEVTLDRPLIPKHQRMIAEHGVTLDDGMSKFAIEKIGVEPVTSGGAAPKNVFGGDKKFLGADRTAEPAEYEYKVTMSEGRNRQIRRTFAALGYTVTNLHRTKFGNFSLNGTKEGEWTEVSR